MRSCRAAAIPCVVLWLGALCGSIACTSGSGAPFELATPDAERFATDVYPVLLRDCAMSECHGAPNRFFSVVGPGRVRLSKKTDPLAPATAEEIMASYDRTRSMLEPAPHAQRSLLLRKPLALGAGGASHRGSDSYGRNVYQSKDDPAYAAIARWALESERRAQAMKRVALMLAACWLSAMGAPVARAYSDPSQFAAPVLEAGGGGRFYTGSPAEGYGCESCHTGAERPALRVSGLPTRYVPRATYEIRVGWGRSIEHAAMVLELTDERGHGAGSLALPAVGTYFDEEQCEPADGSILAAQLYAADRGRTIVAAPDCGASAVRVQWTAPSQSVGPVWLASSVLISNHDGDFTGDGVTTLARPIPAFGEAAPSVPLTGSCDVAGSVAISTPGRTAKRFACLAAILTLARLYLASRRRRRSTARERRAAARGALIATVVAGLCGCGDTSAGEPRIDIEPGDAVRPWDGGQRLGVDAGVDAGASDGGDTLFSDAGTFDAGGQADAGPTTPTQLAFRVTTLSQGGRYAPKNIGAIWIEDSTGHWLKTLAIWASVRERYLAQYRVVNPTHNKVDAVTSATLRAHTTHEVTWDLTDADGDAIPDGDYAVVVEVTDKDAPGKFISVPFTKGSEITVVTADGDAFFTDIELRWL